MPSYQSTTSRRLTMSNNNDNPFKITLLENGIHSLMRGFQSLDQSISTNDDFLLKEAIIFVHHGIELLLKHLLAQENEFLIFVDLNQVAKRQALANEQKISVFDLDEPPNTISYIEAIDRVDAFLHKPEFDKKLKGLLQKLNKQRNKIEHYAIEANRNEIFQLFSDLRSPILNVFEKYIAKFNVESESLVATWNELDKFLNTQTREKIARQLKIHPERSNNWIAKDAGATDKTVEVVRKTLENLGEIPKYDKLQNTKGREYPRRHSPNK